MQESFKMQLHSKKRNTSEEEQFQTAGWGESAEKQLGRGGPGSQGCQQTDHELAMCP